MSDDIVTRLRHIYSQKDVGVSVNPETFTEAADEINHLRNKLEQYHKLLDIYNETCECDGCAACCQYELVVRNYSTN